MLLGLFALLRCWQPDAPREGDRTALLHYVFLLAALCALLVFFAPPPLAAHP